MVTGAPLLIGKLAHPDHRGVAGGLFMCGNYVGAVIAAWVTFGLKDMNSSWCWRAPSVMQLLCATMAFPGFFQCPESPRWLISQGRGLEARQVIASFHAGGNLDAPLTSQEVEEISAMISAEHEAHQTTRYSDMTKTPGNRWRLLITVSLGACSQWSGSGIISYYLTLILNSVGVTETSEQLLISACLQMWNLIFAIVGAVLVDRAGR
ncbi:general substrate transporter [Aspergillus californicus]